jgi:uncharacterized protein (DUF58 family)
MLQSYLDIDPSTLDDIVSFDWCIRSLAQGEQSGIRASRKLGVGMEFSQYRPYSQGDDLRRLDWRMYARTDKYYIKESEIDTHIEITFIIDTSLSMTYSEEGRSKLQFAQILTGLLSHLALSHGDGIGLATAQVHLSHDHSRSWPRFLHQLTTLQTTDKFVPPTLHRKKAKELFVFLTDHYEETDEVQAFASQLKHRANEVMVMHISGPKEVALNFEEGTRLQDLETGRIMSIDSPSFHKEYRERIQEWKQELTSYYLSKGIDYLELNFGSSFSEILSSVYQHRKRLL